MLPELVLVRGGGDLASGAVYRIHRSGIKVIIAEKEKPTSVRRGVSFSQAAYDGKAEVEGIISEKVTEVKEAYKVIERGNIPVLIDPFLKYLEKINPDVLVDATMAKRNTGVNKDMAKKVIALGPGFTAGEDVHAVVETARGHYLGRVIYEGRASPNTKIPGEIGGYKTERVHEAPKAGIFDSQYNIGDQIIEGENFGYVDEEPVKAKISGVVRGILKKGIEVSEGMKLGDIDPRAIREFCFTISDKALAVGGGVLEGVLADGRP